MLPMWANLKPSTFIYPSEDDYVGSTRVFAALHQKLLRDQKMGLTWFVARKNAAPVIAALLPGAEKFSNEGDQLIPAGLWLIPLPFADDIRQNPETPLIRAPEPLIDMMRIIVQQLQLPKAEYRPEKYPNPGKYPLRIRFLPQFIALTLALQLSNGITVFYKLSRWRKNSQRSQMTRPSPSTGKSTRYVLFRTLFSSTFLLLPLYLDTTITSHTPFSISSVPANTLPTGVASSKPNTKLGRK